MEKGTLRVDANVSVRPAGSDELRTRTEIKNMNSFNFIARGIEAEVERQIGVWESGGEVEQQTYDFDAGTGTLTARRSKEEADDYRYFPEPDLVPGRARDASSWSGSACRASRVAGGSHPPNRARARPRARNRARHGRSRPSLGRDRRGRRRGDRRGERDREQPRRRRRRPGGRARRPSSRSSSSRSRAIPRAAFDEAISKLGEPGFSADPYVAQEAVSDAGELGPIVDRILEENPGQVAAYRGGKEGLLGFFVGQVMKETQGKANPRVVSDLVREKLSASPESR